MNMQTSTEVKAGWMPGPLITPPSSSSAYANSLGLERKRRMYGFNFPTHACRWCQRSERTEGINRLLARPRSRRSQPCHFQ